MAVRSETPDRPAAPRQRKKVLFLWKVVGSNIKSLREEMGLSQRRLAELAQTNQPFVCDIENGLVNLTLEKVQEFANVFGIPAALLLVPLHDWRNIRIPPQKETK